MSYGVQFICGDKQIGVDEENWIDHFSGEATAIWGDFLKTYQYYENGVRYSCGGTYVSLPECDPKDKVLMYATGTIYVGSYAAEPVISTFETKFLVESTSYFHCQYVVDTDYHSASQRWRYKLEVRLTPTLEGYNQFADYTYIDPPSSLVVLRINVVTRYPLDYESSQLGSDYGMDIRDSSNRVIATTAANLGSMICIGKAFFLEEVTRTQPTYLTQGRESISYSALRFFIADPQASPVTSRPVVFYHCSDNIPCLPDNIGPITVYTTSPSRGWYIYFLYPHKDLDDVFTSYNTPPEYPWYLDAISPSVAGASLDVYVCKHIKDLALPSFGYGMRIYDQNGSAILDTNHSPLVTRPPVILDDATYSAGLRTDESGLPEGILYTDSSVGKIALLASAGSQVGSLTTSRQRRPQLYPVYHTTVHRYGQALSSYIGWTIAAHVIFPQNTRLMLRAIRPVTIDYMIIGGGIFTYGSTKHLIDMENNPLTITYIDGSLYD